MTISSEDIADQQALLQAHRQTLLHLLQQQATLGAAFSPPGIASGIREARTHIRRIKHVLRSWGISVTDLPDDEAISKEDFEPFEPQRFANTVSPFVQELDDTVQFSPSVRGHMAALNRKVERLTQEQLRVIQMLNGLRRVRISGCAGSGKTLVAAEKALRLSRAGIKTLFLCHNPLLAHHVSHLVAESGVKALSFSSWVSELAGITSGFAVEHWTNYEEPDSQTLNAAFDSLVERGAHYDAIIVDKG